jgi:uroporphyrinogen decarboxylase
MDNYVFAVEGLSSKSFDKKGFVSHTKAAHVLLQKITDTTILYPKEK